jgi:hypothetical protein
MRCIGLLFILLAVYLLLRLWFART